LIIYLKSFSTFCQSSDFIDSIPLHILGILLSQFQQHFYAIDTIQNTIDQIYSFFNQSQSKFKVKPFILPDDISSTIPEIDSILPLQTSPEYKFSSGKSNSEEYLTLKEILSYQFISLIILRIVSLGSISLIPKHVLVRIFSFCLCHLESFDFSSLSPSINYIPSSDLYFPFSFHDLPSPNIFQNEDCKKAFEKIT
jgi:hypothetical protein